MKYRITSKHRHTNGPFVELWDNWSSRMWKSVDASEKQGGIIEQKLMLKLREQLVFNFTFRIFNEI